VTTRLALRVSPGARTNAVVGKHGEAWKIRVSAAPEGGKANAAVVELLADTLGVPARTISVVSGHGARDKLVELSGIAPEEIERRLEAVGRKEARA
jgi:uncharacterized protein YggU (UPF0235/DUF167 family)